MGMMDTYGIPAFCEQFLRKRESCSLKPVTRWNVQVLKGRNCLADIVHSRHEAKK